MNERKVPVRWRKGSFSLGRALTILIFLIIASTIFSLGWVITHPVEEDFTEFYILGVGGVNTGFPVQISRWGEAIGYPEVLASGEEGRVILGVVNKENEAMNYEVEMRIEEVFKQVIGPIFLKQGEQWEEEVGLISEEPSAVTRLIEAIEAGTDTFSEEVDCIEVSSVEHLKVGDHIWIDMHKLRSNEHRRIIAIEENVIRLDEPLNISHEVGAPVVETQKVEFKLYKMREITGNASGKAILSLWLGRENLNASVTNTSGDEAEYEILLKVTARLPETYEETTENKTIGPISLNPGEVWKIEFDYTNPAAIWQKAEFFLYRDDLLLYQENSFAGYPQLHLWIQTVESSTEQ